MTRKEALAELIAKVEAGEPILHPLPAWWTTKEWVNSVEAFEGSLDAAKALHEAVLPGAWAHVRYAGKYGHATVDVKGEEYDANNADNPARAWLLAILRALHAQEAAE